MSFRILLLNVETVRDNLSKKEEERQDPVICEITNPPFIPPVGSTLSLEEYLGEFHRDSAWQVRGLDWKVMVQVGEDKKLVHMVPTLEVVIVRIDDKEVRAPEVQDTAGTVG